MTLNKSFYALFISSLTLFIFPSCGMTETIQTGAIDARIADYLTKIVPDGRGEGDSALNAKLADYLKRVGHDATILTAPLPKSIEAGLASVESSDKRLRFFSWDDGTGGTMRYIKSLVAYRVADHANCEVINSADRTRRAADSVVLVKTRRGSSIYLVISSAAYSTVDYGSFITAYSIQNDRLEPVKVFKTPRQNLHTIECTINLDPNRKTDVVPKISIKENGHVVLVPLVQKNNIVTSRNLVYVFNGDQFVFTPAKN